MCIEGNQIEMFPSHPDTNKNGRSDRAYLSRSERSVTRRVAQYKDVCIHCGTEP